MRADLLPSDSHIIEMFNAVPGVGPMIDVYQGNGWLIAWRFQNDIQAIEPIPYLLEEGHIAWKRVTIN